MGHIKAVLVCLLALCGGCGGGGDQPGQVATVQVMADALVTGDRKVACGANVQELRDGIRCDGVLGPLLHYAPAFPGSRVTRRGRTTAAGRGSAALVPLRYQGPKGSGNLDVTMRREGPTWRVVSILPLL